MAGDPFRERRYGAREVRRILRAALDHADADPETKRAERDLTQQEIEGAASELGLAPTSITRALHDDATIDAGESRADHSLFVGAPTRVLLEREVLGEPSESDREDLVEDIRGLVGETGTIESIGKTFVWRLAPGNGRSRELLVRIRARDGRTKILVEERLSRQALGLFLGLGIGGGIGPLGGYIAALVKLGVLGLAFPLLWIPLMILLARTIFGGIASRREREARKLMERIVKSSASWSSPKTKARVEVRDKARIDAASEADEEESVEEPRAIDRAAKN